VDVPYPVPSYPPGHRVWGKQKGMWYVPGYCVRCKAAYPPFYSCIVLFFRVFYVSVSVHFAHTLGPAKVWRAYPLAEGTYPHTRALTRVWNIQASTPPPPPSSSSHQRSDLSPARPPPQKKNKKNTNTHKHAHTNTHTRTPTASWKRASEAREIGVATCARNKHTNTNTKYAQPRPRGEKCPTYKRKMKRKKSNIATKHWSRPTASVIKVKVVKMQNAPHTHAKKKPKVFIRCL